VRAAVNDNGVLGAPSVGTWHPKIGVGAPLHPGQVLGVLHRAGGVMEVAAPRGAGGVALHVAAPGTWVGFGEEIVQMGEGTGALGTRAPVSNRPADVPDDVSVLTTDTDGTIYLRPEPGSPPFTEEGATLSPMDTVALVEVMKTFTPVRADAGGTVVRVCVEDGASVGAGDPLFWVREG